MLLLLFGGGCKAKKIEDVTDNEKIAIEYSVSSKNNIKYITYKKLMNLFKGEDAILFFGYPESDNAKNIVELLSELTEKEILYFNPHKMEQKSKEYKKLLEKLDSKKLSIPSVYFLKNGKVIKKEDSLSKLEKEDYYTKEDKKKLKKVYQILLKDYFKSIE